MSTMWENIKRVTAFCAIDVTELPNDPLSAKIQLCHSLR